MCHQSSIWGKGTSVYIYATEGDAKALASCPGTRIAFDFLAVTCPHQSGGPPQCLLVISTPGNQFPKRTGQARKQGRLQVPLGSIPASKIRPFARSAFPFRNANQDRAQHTRARAHTHTRFGEPPEQKEGSSRSSSPILIPEPHNMCAKRERGPTPRNLNQWDGWRDRWAGTQQRGTWVAGFIDYRRLGERKRKTPRRPAASAPPSIPTSLNLFPAKARRRRRGTHPTPGVPGSASSKQFPLRRRPGWGERARGGSGAGRLHLVLDTSSAAALPAGGGG